MLAGYPDFFKSGEEYPKITRERLKQGTRKLNNYYRINFRSKTIHFFECNKCGAVVSFTGRKKVTFGITEAENPIKNWNRRADNEV